MSESTFDADVVVVGSGFGGSVAALRMAEAGQRVCVLERGPWIERETNEVDLDALWNPRRHRFGMNDLRSRGDNIVPWLGAGVGGGSHVYAGTLKRGESWDGFPAQIRGADMDAYFDRAESMMDAQHFPDRPPYNEIRATQLLYGVGRTLTEQRPDVVEDYGPINLAISFAPEGVEPGSEFVNKHGATQRYSDPREQSLLGGDIGAKNTLDRNYLHLAQSCGVEIRPLCDVGKLEPVDGGGYRLHYKRYVQEPSALRRLGRKWLPWLVGARDETESITARRVVLAAGCVGSTELLMRARDVDETMPDLSPALGSRYTTNGDFISLILPFRGLFVSWLGFIAALVGLVMWNQWIALAGGVAYFLGLWASQRPFDPDIGTTNSDFIRFKGPNGETQGAYIESGRYPTPVRFGLAVVLSSLGLWRPRRYYKIVRFTHFLQRWVPPFAMLARSWPIPLLKMGKDEAMGTFRLDGERVVIDYDWRANQGFYAYLNGLGKLVARAAHAWWMPNVLFSITKRLEIPHNQGGVPMGDDAASGVVDHAGRVFGYRDLMVLDGSILPVSPGPNPALTILAVSERAMDVVADQLKNGGTIAP